MPKIVIDSKNFIKTPGMQSCNKCPLKIFKCKQYFNFLFGSSCEKVKVELKDGSNVIEFLDDNM